LTPRCSEQCPKPIGANNGNDINYTGAVGEDQSPPQRQRVTVAEAAELLGISAEAVRMRIRRGTLRFERHQGTVYVLLDTNQTRHVDNATADQPMIVARLENEVRFLREELTRKDAILLNMTEAMKALSPPDQEEAPPEPPEAPVTATEQPGRMGPQTPIEGAQEPVTRRYRWWQFWR
jgi:excisionase family DNA binding protein